MASDDSKTPAKSNYAPAGKRRVTIDDLYRIRLVGDPQVSPDGRMVAFTQTRLRRKKNDYGANIWLVPADGSDAPRKFTGSNGRDMFPRWSPDGGEIAFLSTRSGKPQIWVIPVGGGEARQLTRGKRGASEFVWSPDGKWIVFATEVDNEYDIKAAAEAKAGKKSPAQESPDSENRGPGQGSEEGLPVSPRMAGEWEEDEEDETLPEQKGDRAHVITRVHIKGEGAGLLLHRTHLFIVSSRGGNPRQITEGEWDAAMPRFSPDGKTITFVAAQGEDAELTTKADIYALDVDEEGKTGEPRRLTRNDSVIMSYDWLPSGDGFAVFAHDRVHEGAYGTNAQLWKISLDGEITRLTPGFDRTVGTVINSDLWSGTGEVRPRFSADGSTVYFLVTEEGTAHIYSVPVGGGKPTRVIEGARAVLNFGVAEEGLVFAASSQTHPCDLVFARFDGSDEKQLTYANTDFLEEVDIANPRKFWLERPGGVQVEGWLLVPPDFDESRKWPLVLQIHGGPHVAYGEAFFHEFQILAARGYVVLFTNPRGSQGYGQEFSDAILNDWGGVDYDDIMACVDHVIEMGFIDTERMAVAGGSYGGYMTAWVIGHTRRFKAAVAMRAVINLYSAWGSGDYTWALWNWEMGGTPQERTELYLERSPITYVKEMTTPLLITHSEDDLRVNIEQADELYMSLKVLKREVKMVRFPSGGHDISRSGKPSLRIERLEHIAGWIDSHLGNEE